MTDYILCIDPGDMTGWATIELDGKGAPKDFDNITFEEFSERISEYRRFNAEALRSIEGRAESSVREFEKLLPVAIIYEEYRKRPGARHATGNKYLASQVIGITRNFATEFGIKLIAQVPANKNTGAKWSGLLPPKRHAESHCYDAYNHGFYYLRNQRLVQTKLERTTALDGKI